MDAPISAVFRFHLGRLSTIDLSARIRNLRSSISSARRNRVASVKPIVIFAALVGGAAVVSAQTQSSSSAPASIPAQSPVAPSPPPIPLSTPSLTGPLRAAPPRTFDGGPLGKLSLNGVLTGSGLVQSTHMAGDSSSEAFLSEAQIFLQKPDGGWQFYVQAGAYNILSLGAPFLPTGKQVSDLYGPVPVAFLRLAPGKNTSVQIGALPTLMGAEYTFDFENMNIERGLLWYQENAINRGVQVNQTMGKFAASLSWNDGYYSSRYSWLSGSLAYTNGPHDLTLVGMGNLSHTAYQTLATPIQNNSVMYALEYTYSNAGWIVQPYWQLSNVPTDREIGIARGASTDGGALLVSRTFTHGFSLAGRGEYLSTSGTAAEGAVNLLYGAGSSAWSATVTPTFQRQRFFVRGDIAVVRAVSFTPGNAFGPTGTDDGQIRGVVQIGLLF